MNAITIYVLQYFVDFGLTAKQVFGSLAEHLPTPAGAVVLAVRVLQPEDDASIALKTVILAPASGAESNR